MTTYYSIKIDGPVMIRRKESFLYNRFNLKKHYIDDSCFKDDSIKGNSERKNLLDNF